MTDISYKGRTALDRLIATRTDGSASYWRLARGYAARSIKHMILTRDGRIIMAATEASALKKLAAI